MNKKLFFAGFALLAAVSFTSCNSDNPIDITNPNGVTPAAATHYVGGEYDWTAIVANYDDLKKFWAEDGKKVADLLKDNKDKTADILIDVTGYELKATDGAAGNGFLMIPDFWAANGGTATADGKVVNITFKGSFKNADFERANAIAHDLDPSVALKNLPVKINTDNLAGAEVNFTFDEAIFDLDLASSLTRSTLSGDYTIGYLKAQAARTLSATEFKSGTIEGFDNTSTGDFKGEIAGVWVQDFANSNLEVTAKGIKVGTTDNYTVYGKNIFVETNTTLDTWYKAGSNDAQYKIGTVMFVKPAVLFLNGTKNSGAADVDAIENIVGFDKSKCMVVTRGIGKDFSKIDAVEKVTVCGSTTSAETTLEKDIFTDVYFADPVKFNTGKITAFENVTFEALTIEVDANDKTLNFTSVNFMDEAKMTSTMEIENTVAYTTYVIYQWVVDNTQPKGGYWELYNNNGNAVAGRSIKAYNEGLAIGEYSDTHIVLADGANSVGKGAQGSPAEVAEAETYRLLKITHYNGAGKVTVTPENTKVVLDGACQFWNGGLAKTDAALNIAWGNKGAAVPGGAVVPNAQEVAWYAVEYNEIPYKWVASLDATGAFAKYILVKNQ